MDLLRNRFAFRREHRVVRSAISGGTEKIVAVLEQQWLQSQKANNIDLLALADKFSGTRPDGNLSDKTQTLAEAKATKYDSLEYEDVKAVVFGDAATATGGGSSKGTNASGKSMDEHVRWTDTWVKMPNGKGQCGASHVSPIKN